MAVKIFQPSIHKPEAMNDLRGGMSPEKCAVKYNISERTVYRYLKEITEGSFKAKPGQITKPRSSPIRITVDMDLADIPKILSLLRYKEEAANGK